jgi:hypothetical protein
VNTGSSRRDSILGSVVELERVAAELARRDPPLFRAHLFVERGAKRSFSREMLDFQTRDFAALEGAWTQLVRGGESSSVVRRHAYLERPRGHSKTTDTAVQLAWALIASRRPLRGLAAAADLDQAALIHDALRRLLDANPHFGRPLKFVENAVRNPDSGSVLKIISSDVRGSWGELPDFVVCDELCHWKSPDLWHSLVSSAAKKPESVLIVLSNAGHGRGWQWEAREAARTSPAWYFTSLDRPQAPWITEESLAEQRRLLPPAVFARLWLNQWQHSDGEFVSLAEASACRDERLAVAERGEPGRVYVAAIDYAEKRDLTVGCVAHRASGVVIVDRMDVVRPQADRPTPVKWVSHWMHSTAAAFPGVRFVVDAYQLVSVIQELKEKYPIERIEFRAGQANHDMAVTLRQLILEGRLRWYPGCGTVIGEEELSPRDDLEHELASLIVREQGGGRFRFDHLQDGRHHDDRSFALSVACLKLLNAPENETPVWNVTPPERGLLGMTR